MENIPGKAGIRGIHAEVRACDVSAELRTPPGGWCAQCERRTGRRGAQEPDCKVSLARLSNVALSSKFKNKQNQKCIQL